MTDRPIIFSGPMVRALLAGTKTQTRRVLKPRPGTTIAGATVDAGPVLGGIARRLEVPAEQLRVPYSVGDRLWVRETLEKANGEAIGYPADGTWLPNEPWIWKRDTLPSIHMPRWLSRLTLTATEVRVQRLQDISEGDAVAEGATMRPKCRGFRNQYDGWSMDWSEVGKPSRFGSDGGRLDESDVSLGSATAAFAAFINALHDPRWNLKGDGIWGQNPWVAAVTFGVTPANIDSLTEHPHAG